MHILQFRDRLAGISSREKSGDRPPSYDDVMKSEPPPPAYYSVVEETPSKGGLEKLKKNLMATGAIPKVFKIGKSSANNSQCEKSTEVVNSAEAVNKGSLYIVDEHYAASTSASSSMNIPNYTHPVSSSSEGLPIPDMIRSPIIDNIHMSVADSAGAMALPPSYDSLDFSVSNDAQSLPTPHRKLSQIVVDVTEQE